MDALFEQITDKVDSTSNPVYGEKLIENKDPSGGSRSRKDIKVAADRVWALLLRRKPILAEFMRHQAGAMAGSNTKMANNGDRR